MFLLTLIYIFGVFTLLALKITAVAVDRFS